MTNLFKRKGSDKSSQERELPERVLLNTFTPNTPGVNIIPDDVLTRYADDRMRTKFIASAIGLAVIGCLGFVGSSFAVNNSETQLQELQTEHVALQAQTAKLAPGKQYVDMVDKKRDTLVSKVSRDIAYSMIISELNDIARQNGTSLTSISITPLIPIAEATGGNASECPSPDPFGASTGIACISFTADSDTDTSANNFASTLESQSETFNSVFITSMSRTQGAAITIINGSVLATAGALTSRFEGLNQDLYSYLANLAPAADEDSPALEEEVTP